MKKKTEKEVRDGLLEHAQRLGAKADLEHLFDKWDRLLALASPAERTDMARRAILEVQSLLDVNAAVGGLTINDEVVVPITKKAE